MMKHLVLIMIWGISILMLRHFFDLSEKLSLFIFLIGLIAGLQFRSLSITKAIPFLMLAFMLAWLATIQASNNRDWLDEISKLPNIHMDNKKVTIENFRNFTWQGINESNLNWESRSYDLDKLQSLYLYVVPFHDSKYMAHTMLGFDFQDQGIVMVSVETRKEKGEDYSLVAGALRQLELIYVFGSEQDLLTLRAVHRKANIHLYPVKAEADFIISLFQDLAQSANALHHNPQFYRTLRDNCTTTLVKHIDRHYEEKIGMRMEIIFPAKAGELLYEFNRMDTHLSYEQAHEVSRIDHLVKQYADEENFSSLLHANVSLVSSKK